MKKNSPNWRRWSFVVTFTSFVFTWNLPSFATPYSDQQIESTLRSPYANWGITPSVEIGMEKENILKKNKKDSKTPLKEVMLADSPDIKLESALKIFDKKQDVIVVVIDTGIEINHPHLKDNIISIKELDKMGTNFEVVKATENNFGKDFSNPKKITNLPKDTHGHGTHVSGLVKSIFPDVKVLSLKYFNPESSGQQNLDASIAAMNYVAKIARSNLSKNYKFIINFSGGGPGSNFEEQLAIYELMKADVLLVAAAGNFDKNIDDSKNKSNEYFPASYDLIEFAKSQGANTKKQVTDNIIAVAGINKNNKLHSSSNFGKKSVDIAAPGTDINSSTRSLGSINQASTEKMTGTSQATAFVTGTACLLMSMFPKLPSAVIKNLILFSSDKLKTLENFVASKGKLNAYKAIKLGVALEERLNQPKSKITPKTKRLAKK
ncbi:MAG: S8 family serine peptidase [Bacteriovoracaceae bacterium]|nr:S8 family serine peptidase [Bacteriovoracaceae bacterium]